MRRLLTAGRKVATIVCDTGIELEFGEPRFDVLRGRLGSDESSTTEGVVESGVIFLASRVEVLTDRSSVEEGICRGQAQNQKIARRMSSKALSRRTLGDDCKALAEGIKSNRGDVAPV